MKILLMGEYSSLHSTLAEGLRTLGHQVTVVSNGDFWKDYPRDVDVSRPEGHFGGLRLLARVVRLLPTWRGYDVVQLVNPMFLELRAERLFSIYRYLRHHNRCIVLGAFGIDWYWVHTCSTEMPLRYSDFNFGKTLRTDKPAVREQADWIGTAKERLNKTIAEDCDAIVTCLYEYDVCYRPHFPQKTHFIPLPIKITPSYNPSNPISPISPISPITPISPISPIKLFIGISRGRSAYKGTDIMLEAAQAIAKRYPDRIKVVKAEGVPYHDYQRLMEGSDALLDHLYSYPPAMNALLAMSKGIICIGGGEPENYEIINEHELHPIINVEPNYESVCQQLELLAQHPEDVPQLKQQSREYVARHHDHVKVARQYEQLYLSLLNQPT